MSKDASKKQVHRLEDLLVEEVSIVDRPANKRPFLMVKSAEGGERGAEVVPGEGGALVTETTPTPPAATPPAPAPTQKNEAPVDEPKMTPAFVALFDRIEKALTITPEIRREIFRDLGDAQKRIGGVMCLADFAPTDFDGKEPSDLVPLFAKELSEVSGIIDGVAKRLGKLSKNAPPEPPAEDPVAKGLTALTEALESKIEKRGAKMSAARLGKFKTALDALHKLLAELETVTDSAPAEGRTTKVDEQVEKALSGAAEGIERLQEKVKKQAREIHDLRNARPAGNALPVDADPPAPKAEKVVWPRDLNG